jgi:hypothetical protein
VPVFACSLCVWGPAALVGVAAVLARSTDMQAGIVAAGAVAFLAYRARHPRHRTRR